MTDGNQTPGGQDTPQGGWLPPSAPGSEETPTFGAAPPPRPQVEGLPPADAPVGGVPAEQPAPSAPAYPQAPPPAYPQGPPAGQQYQYVPPPGQQPPPGAPPPGYGWPQQPQPGWYQPGPSRPTNGTAVAALVLGIAGIAVTLMFAGILFIVSIPCSIAAWVLGVKGKRIAAPDPNLEPTRPAGRGLAQAGLVTGIVGLVLAILGILFWVLLLSLGDLDLSEFETEPDQDLFQSVARAAGPAARMLLGLG